MFVIQRLRGIEMTVSMVLVIAMVSIALLPHATRAQNVNITLAPAQTSVDAGQTITFFGEGFHRHERLDSWATDPTGAVTRGEYAKADGDGSVEIRFYVPEAAMEGVWTLTARGDQSKVPVWASFTVFGRPALAAQPIARVAPSQGAAGMVFAFAADGMEKGERVSYWITDPNGQVFFANPGGVTANRHGYVEFTWESPTDALLGRWVMTMQGYESERARAIPFVITTGNMPSPTNQATPQATSQAVPRTPTPTAQYRSLPTYEPVPMATMTARATATAVQRCLIYHQHHAPLCPPMSL